MTEKLEALFTGAVKPGVYRTSLRTVATTLARAAESRGWLSFHLDGSELATKAQFLEASARAMRFPSYFGHNWDAFEDSLNDMSWAPAQGYLVVFDDAGRFAQAQPDEFHVALDILRSSVARWQEQGTPMMVLLRKVGRVTVDLPRL